MVFLFGDRLTSDLDKIRESIDPLPKGSCQVNWVTGDIFSISQLSNGRCKDLCFYLDTNFTFWDFEKRLTHYLDIEFPLTLGVMFESLARKIQVNNHRFLSYVMNWWKIGISGMKAGWLLLWKSPSKRTSSPISSRSLNKHTLWVMLCQLTNGRFWEEIDK